MSSVDKRGCSISGAAPAAMEAYERALAAFQGWRSGADVQLALALQEAPTFVMAHVLQAYLLVCGRDPRRVRSARPVQAVGDEPCEPFYKSRTNRKRQHPAAWLGLTWQHLGRFIASILSCTCNAQLVIEQCNGWYRGRKSQICQGPDGHEHFARNGQHH